MRISAIPTLLILGLSCGLTASSLAQEAEADRDEAASEPPVHRQEIVVSATRTERPGDALPLSVTIISQSDIEEAPVLAVDDLLRTVPGVNLPGMNSTSQHASSGRLSMRGLGDERALVMVDGIPINDGFRGYIHWQEVALEDLERIEIVRGGSASLFGNYALGGTINMITRPVTRSEIDLRALYGELDSSRLSLAVRKMFGPRLGLDLSAQRFETDGYVRKLPEDRLPIDTRSPSDSLRAQLRADYAPSSRFSGFARASTFDLDLSLGTPLWKSRSESTDISTSNHLRVGRDGDLAISGFYKDLRLWVNLTSISARGDSEILTSELDTPARDFGGSAQWTRSLGSRFPLVSVGMDVRHIDAESLTTRFAPSGSIAGVTTVTGTQTFWGTFGQLSWTPSDELEVLLSGRLDVWQSENGREQITGGTTTTHPAQRATEVDPRVSIRYRFAPGIAMRAAAYRAFRAPTLEDLYRSNFRRQANPDLTSEVMTGGDVGADLGGRRWRAEANVFWTRTTDTITEVPVSIVPFLVVQPRNVGETRSRGFESMAEFRPHARWSVQSTYTWTDAEIVDSPADPALEGNRLPRIPEHVGTFGVRYADERGFVGSVRARALSSSWEEAANQVALDEHLVIDIYGAWPLRPGVTLLIIGENLFDAEYVAEAPLVRRMSAPRRIYGGFRVEMPF